MGIGLTPAAAGIPIWVTDSPRTANNPKSRTGTLRAIIAGIITARRLKGQKGIHYDESV